MWWWAFYENGFRIERFQTKIVCIFLSRFFFVSPPSLSFPCQPARLWLIWLKWIVGSRHWFFNDFSQKKYLKLYPQCRNLSIWHSLASLCHSFLWESTVMQPSQRWDKWPVMLFWNESVSWRTKGVLIESNEDWVSGKQAFSGFCRCISYQH